MTTTNTTTAIDLSTLTASELLQLAQQKAQAEREAFLIAFKALEEQAKAINALVYPHERDLQIAFALARCEELGIRAHLSKRASTNSRPNGMDNQVGVDLALNLGKDSKSLPLLDYLLQECLKLHAAGKAVCTGEVTLRALGLDHKQYTKDVLRSALNSIDSGNVAFDRYGVVRHAGKFLGFCKTVTEKVAAKQVKLFADLPADFLAQYPLSNIGEALAYHRELEVKQGMVALPVVEKVKTLTKAKDKKAA